MAESVPVACPACRREQSFTPPTFPCPCGAPVTVPVLPGRPPEPLEHPTWENTWVAVRCPACGRQDEWPHPEIGCACGAVLRPAVAPVPAPSPSDLAPSRAGGGASAPAPRPVPARAPCDTAPLSSAVPRPAFRPVTIRTGRDAVTAAAQYLKWLGFREVVRASDHPVSGVDLRGRDVIAQVDPTTRPSTLRDIECLWLNALNSSLPGVFFSLAGYAREARARADELRLPLFVMDLTGTPQPVNDAADDLIRMGPGA
ncbi:hypothetical protein [Streptomyces sp. URMC 123]|uniref:hypothetical protein n=1 Tax=Streptomyces sp. URMC 123 TaxID=3423403 RepID=UPI003F19FE0C